MVSLRKVLTFLIYLNYNFIFLNPENTQFISLFACYLIIYHTGCYLCYIEFIKQNGISIDLLHVNGHNSVKKYEGSIILNDSIAELETVITTSPW